MHYTPLASYSIPERPVLQAPVRAPMMAGNFAISPVTGELMVPGNAGVVIQADSGKQAIRIGGTAMTSNMTLSGNNTTLNQIQFFSNDTLVSAFDQQGLYFPDTKGIYFGTSNTFGALTYSSNVTTLSAPTTINLRVGATNIASISSSGISATGAIGATGLISTTGHITSSQSIFAANNMFIPVNGASSLYFTDNFNNGNPTASGTRLRIFASGSTCFVDFFSLLKFRSTNLDGSVLRDNLLSFFGDNMYLQAPLGTSNPIWCSANNVAGFMISNNWNSGNPNGGTAGYYKMFCNGDKNIYIDFHNQLVYRSTHEGGNTVSNTVLVVSNGGLSVSGSISGYSSLSPSDFRLKNTIEPIDTALDSILKLKPSTFFYNTKPDKKFAGFIAQEVLPILPLAVEKRDDDYYDLNQPCIIPYLVKAVQELSEQVTELTKQVSALKNDK